MGAEELVLNVDKFEPMLNASERGQLTDHRYRLLRRRWKPLGRGLWPGGSLAFVERSPNGRPDCTAASVPFPTKFSARSSLSDAHSSRSAMVKSNHGNSGNAAL
jgi:hypothetical protein